MTPEQKKAFNKYVGITDDSVGSLCGTEVMILAEVAKGFLAGWDARQAEVNSWRDQRVILARAIRDYCIRYRPSTMPCGSPLDRLYMALMTADTMHRERNNAG